MWHSQRVLCTPSSLIRVVDSAALLQPHSIKVWGGGGGNGSSHFNLQTKYSQRVPCIVPILVSVVDCAALLPISQNSLDSIFFSLFDFCLDPLFHFYLFISCFFVVLFASFWERGSDNGNDDEGFVFLFSEGFLFFIIYFLRICCTLELHCLPVSVEASYTGSMGRWQYIGRG